ncbi:hypothetical protein FQ085_14870 [Planococcus sp. ANT_H30]|uniref:hypothetical protein n=1 Tax=Planococcus sp. ANT_H30 TaxID=2597347 RepID=UPI0011ED9139|nr:hypothetical protein [Planococcus sp. ANT_H30]KAA0956124.1 hypothetical protein FQ085_14870 [Planococcus sp. ANT_H30]
MERIIILVLIVGTTIIAYLLHSYQKKREEKRHVGKSLFMGTFIVSLVVFPVSFLMKEPFAYYMGVSAIFLFFLSINGFAITKILEMSEARQQQNL